MATVQINARMDEDLKKAIEEYCRSRGIVINHFIQEALLDRLEELEDIEDLKGLRHEPTRPLSEVLRELKLDGKLSDRSHSNGGEAASAAFPGRSASTSQSHDRAGRRAATQGLAKVLTGYDDVYRIRAGHYRILYSIFRSRLVILVLKIGHRREIYR